jgi:uncharacterized membrane protein
MLFLENSLFVLPFSTGLVFIIAGLIMKHFPPKKINLLYGYRSNRSMRSKENWNFAQQFSMVLMIKLGVVLMLLSFLGLLFNFGEKSNIILGFVFLFSMVFLLIFLTEKELKKRFPKH